jgi:hypothetical protein
VVAVRQWRRHREAPDNFNKLLTLMWRAEVRLRPTAKMVCKVLKRISEEVVQEGLIEQGLTPLSV